MRRRRFASPLDECGWRPHERIVRMPPRIEQATTQLLACQNVLALALGSITKKMGRFGPGGHLSRYCHQEAIFYYRVLSYLFFEPGSLFSRLHLIDPPQGRRIPGFVGAGCLEQSLQGDGIEPLSGSPTT